MGTKSTIFVILHSKVRVKSWPTSRRYYGSRLEGLIKTRKNLLTARSQVEV